MNVSYKDVDAIKGTLESFDPEHDTMIVLITKPDGSVTAAARTKPGDFQLIGAGSKDVSDGKGGTKIIRWDDHFATSIGSKFAGETIAVGEGLEAILKCSLQVRPFKATAPGRGVVRDVTAADFLARMKATAAKRIGAQ